MIPIVYNLESLRERWSGSLVAVLGIAGTVAVFVATLSLANGFRATLIASGLEDNAIVRRAGATAEMDSAVSIAQARVIEDQPLVARDDRGALVSPEVVALAVFPARADGNDSNVQMRGVGSRVLAVRRGVTVVEGRFLTSGTNEAVVGSNAAKAYAELEVGRSL